MPEPESAFLIALRLIARGASDGNPLSGTTSREIARQALIAAGLEWSYHNLRRIAAEKDEAA